MVLCCLYMEPNNTAWTNFFPILKTIYDKQQLNNDLHYNNGDSTTKFQIFKTKIITCFKFGIKRKTSVTLNADEQNLL